MADEEVADEEWDSRAAYAAMTLGGMTPQQRAGWYGMTGQTKQAQAWQAASVAQAAGKIGLGALQAGLAFAIEKAPGVAPPPFKGRVWWTPEERAAREEQYAGQMRVLATEQRKRREAAAAASGVRTSAAVGERAARTEMRELRKGQESARAQRLREEVAEAKVKQAEKIAAKRARFQYRVQERERKRQAKQNLLLAAGKIGAEVLTTGAQVAGAAGIAARQRRETAAKLGMLPGELRTALSAKRRLGAIGQKQVGLEDQMRSQAEAAMLLDPEYGAPTKAQWAQWNRLKAQEKHQRDRFQRTNADPALLGEDVDVDTLIAGMAQPTIDVGSDVFRSPSGVQSPLGVEWWAGKSQLE